MNKYKCKELITIYDENKLFKEREIHEGDVVSICSFYNNNILLKDSDGLCFSMGYLVFKDYFEEVKE